MSDEKGMAWMYRLHYDPEILSPVVRVLSPYDPWDILATIAGLQLLPENADRTIRLEALAHAAASLETDPAKPRISLPRLRQIADSDPLGRGAIASQEDPFNAPFTEAFMFHGSSFMVFPGIAEDSTFILRHLTDALFLSPDPFPDKRFLGKARALLTAVLALSDEMANRAGLRRGEEPRTRQTDDGLFVPGSQYIARYKQAVSFDLSELASFLARYGASPDALKPLMVLQGDVPTLGYQNDTGTLLAHPLVRSGDQLIVAIPGTLLTAARHELIRLACEHGVEDELAKRYNAAVWNTVGTSLSYLKNTPLSLPLPDAPPIPCLQRAFFRLDTDKVIYTLLMTDPLRGYDLQHPFAEWPLQESEGDLRDHLRAVSASVANLESPPTEVCFLVLLQGIGRPMVWGFAHADVPPDALLLGMLASDLQTIALLEGGEPLTLWKFARLSSSVKERTRVGGMSPLDEFYLYRSYGYSYYVSDDPRPDYIAPPPDGGGALRREVLRQRDWHVVLSYDPTYVVEVTALFDTAAISIYVPMARDHQRVALLVEGNPLPLWIVGQPPPADEKAFPLYSYYFDFADAIAYWLWQCTPALAPLLQPVASLHSRILLRIALPEDEAWDRSSPEGLPSPQQDSLVVCPDAVRGTLDITIHATFASALEREDNSGERALMRHILQGFRSLLTEEGHQTLSDDAIAAILDRHAPLGTKKKLLFLDPSTAPDLDPRGLPAYRKIQEADENELLDELGEHLRSVEGLREGTVAPEKRAEVLRSAVGFYYQALVQLVASLQPEGLLEYLIAHHEAIVRELSLHRLTIPTRLACYSSEPEMIERLSEELPERAAAARASRFVIEYVAACPPDGQRPVSLSVYDRLQALAWHIINFGSVSDFIYYQLADLQLAMLPSGRLAVDQKQLKRALDSYQPLFAAGEIVEATRTFRYRWHGEKAAQEESVIADAMLSATRAEFGYTLYDVLLLMTKAIELGSERDSGAVCLPESELLSLLVERLNWSEDAVRQALESLTLDTRPDFLTPPPPFLKSDIHPWQFNRRLSYLRRPFLRRRRGDDTEILYGYRHLYNAGGYLSDLCLNGRLQARSHEMQQAISQVNNKRGDAFNAQVAHFLEEETGLIIKSQVKKVGELRGQDGPPGDIDVLMVNPRKRRMHLLECKDLAVARTPQEMANELQNMFQGKGGKKSVIEHHQKRVQWACEHLGQILTWLELPQSGKWKVEPLIVTKQRLFTPYLQRSPIPILSFDELRERYG